MVGLLAVVVQLGLVAAFRIPLPARLSLPGSAVLRWQDGTVAHATLAPDDRWRIPVTRDDVDPAYVDALVRLEDRRFWMHPGVDPLAIGRAALSNLRQGQVVSGASTLTMQVVRLAEPRPRTLRSKVVEAARAIQLELRLSKEEILASYLTLVPYGGNLEGVEAASLAFFGHGAAHLSPEEIATLLAIPQSPTRRAPRPDGDLSHVPALQAARDEIADRLLAHGLLERHLTVPDDPPAGQGVAAAEDAAAEDAAAVSAHDVAVRIRGAPVPAVRRPLPRDVPHAAAWLLGDGADLASTLDAGVQRVATVALQGEAEARRARGIEHGAVVVVEHATGEVRALVGGTDFWAHRAGAQIPAFAVPRSPGSTLKPFLYGRALDEGRLLPDTLLLDVPVRYGGYSPENYDGDHAGMVRAEDALSRSLNVPFVELLGEVGVEPFLGDLRALGAGQLVEQPGHYGLSLVVGGVELSPLDLAGMYAALARGGQARALRLRADAHGAGDRADAAGAQVLSPGAAWLTARTLARRDRPDFPARAELSRLPSRIHWKTGTSFGNRDAWAVGSGRRYTVAVWLGNLDQKPSAALVGADAAGPVLFDVLDGLADGHPGDPWQPGRAPAQVVPVEVCALSGQLPGAACPETRQAMGLERSVPTTRCALHVALQVDAATGLRVGPGCRQGRRIEDEVRVSWPPEVRRWLAASMLALPRPPSWDPACPVPSTGGGPKILSPTAGQVAVLIPGVPAGDQELPLEAAAGVGDGPLTWFVGGREVGRAPPDQPVWWAPQAGAHEVVVVDRHGRVDRATLRVQAPQPGLAGG